MTNQSELRAAMDASRSGLGHDMTLLKEALRHSSCWRAAFEASAHRQRTSSPPNHDPYDGLLHWQDKKRLLLFAKHLLDVFPSVNVHFDKPIANYRHRRKASPHFRQFE